jgi:hypothetical protein
MRAASSNVLRASQAQEAPCGTSNNDVRKGGHASRGPCLKHVAQEGHASNDDVRLRRDHAAGIVTVTDELSDPLVQLHVVHRTSEELI